jgi:uncharacterized membrane protein
MDRITETATRPGRRHAGVAGGSADVRVGARVEAIDWARGAALLGMIGFHVLFDLRMLGLLPPEVVLGTWFGWWARIVAGSFLFLAGLSLWLGHGDGLRWRGFARRLAVLVTAAAVVSLATRIAVPEAWVRFGILHAIALASVLCLPFLRLPPWATLGAAGLVLFALPSFRSAAWDGAWLLWLGLGETVPPMIDWEPMVPWLAPALAGVAAGRLGSKRGWWDRLARLRGPAWLGWPGRHSLAIYLLHQPVIIGGMLAWIWLGS